MSNRPLIFGVLLAAGFAPLIEGGTTHLPFLVLKLLVIALILITASSSLKEGVFRLPRTALDPAVPLILIISFVSLIIAPYKYMALTWVQLIVFYTVYYYAASMAFTEKKSIYYAVWLIAGMGALESAWGVYQYVMDGPAVKGSFFNPSMLAAYIAVCIVMAASLLSSFHARRTRGWYVPALVLIVLLGIGVIVLSASRGGILALSAGLLVVLWHRSRGGAIVAVATLVILVFAVPNPVRDKVFSGAPLNYTRLQIWENTITRMSDHPEGLGLGNYKYYSDVYRFPVKETIRYGTAARTAHNEYLHFGSETGLPGIVVIGICLFLTGRMLVTAVRLNMGGEYGAVAAGVNGGVASILAHSLVDSNLHEPGIVFMLLLLLAMGARLSMGGGVGVRPFDLTGTAGKRAVVLAAVLILLVSFWAVRPELAWYYNQEGIKALKAGMFDDALEKTARAVSLEPGNAAYHEQKASVIYAMRGKDDVAAMIFKALAELDLAGELNPLNYRYPLLKAKLKHELAESAAGPRQSRDIMEDSVRDLSQAAAAAPYNAEVLYRLAAGSLELGRADYAVEVLERLRKYEPDFFRGRLLLAQLYGQRGRRELSTKEAYSIIQDHEMLAGRISGPREKEFTGVDMGAVRALAQHTGTFE